MPRRSFAIAVERRTRRPANATRSHLVCYLGRTMTRSRAGNTIKISVSLSKGDLATLRRRAKESFGGNLSAAIAEAAKWIRQQEARRDLIEMLGGSVLTPASSAAIQREQTGEEEAPKRRTRRVA